MKFVIIDTLSLTEKIKAGQEPVPFNEHQSVLRVNEKNADILLDYKKYTAEEFLNLDKSLIAQSKKTETKTSSQLPFATKQLENGKKLFQRVEGSEFELTVANNDNVLEFQVPYNNVKFNELEVINGELGDKVQLNILDDDHGTISTIAKFNLNTFGGKTSKVNVKPEYYQRKSNYDADLFNGMYIQIKYETVSDKTVYINYILHEIV